MIHVDRQRVPEPSILTSKLAAAEKEVARRQFAMADQLKGFVRHRFELYQHPDVRKALLDLFRQRCAFCDSIVGFGTDANSVHFRPQSHCVDERGRHLPKHYWWLASEWTNLYLSCRHCQAGKANRFPVLGQRSPIEGDRSALDAEQQLLLDPCVDHPEEHFEYHPSNGQIRAHTERGQASIEMFGLNRRDLVLRRADAIEQFLAREGSASTAELLDEDQPFLGLRRQLVEQRSQRSQQGRGTRSAEVSASPRPKEGFALEPEDQAPEDQASEEQAPEAQAPDEPAFEELASDEAMPAAEGFDEAWSKSVKGSFSLDSLGTTLAPEAIESIRSRIEQVGKVMANTKAYSLAKQTLGAGDDDGVQTERYFFQQRLIDRITLSDFKSIEALDLHCAPSRAAGAGWTMLLGENGTGKSSVLEAVALALAGHDYRSQLLAALDPDRSVEVNAAGLIRRPRSGRRPSRATVAVDLTDGTRAELTIHDDGEIEANPAADDGRVLLLGYGATRLLPRTAVPTPGTEYARVDNLFDPFVPLGDARRWLLDLSETAFEDLVPPLAQLLGLREPETLKQNHDEARIDVHVFDSVVSLEQMSAGYQSVVALAVDLLSMLRTLWGDALAVAEGIVLLDEIGAHLHPKWRMRLVQSLRHTFPRVQFLVSTHDPLCLRGLDDGEVIAMRRDTSGRVSATSDLPPVAGLRVDQLLTSEHFGLSSTIDPSLEKDFEEYYALLLRQEQGGVLPPSASARLTALRQRLTGLRLLGETRRERILLEAIDRHLAREEAMSAEQRQTARGDLELQLDELLDKMEL